MCLNRREDIVHTIKKRLKKANNGYIICWKVLKKYDDLLLSPVSGTCWTSGFNFSTANKKECTNLLIHLGIHVFLKKGDAIKYTSIAPETKVVPVLCFRQDFIAAGVTHFISEHPSAVFHRVYLPRKSYCKALRD